MSFPREQAYLSTCPVCQNQIDVTALDPFTKLKCPFCGQMVRVRRKFDHFMIVRQIGEGGMSRVFEAEDETLGRRVALKILNHQFGRDAVRVEQFRQEALITANVNHPNVIKLYSVGYDQGYFYIAMELVGGGTLEQMIRRQGTIKEKEALRIGREVAEGLRAAQQQGLIHRDVKPANILFTETGTAKVVDFGLALFVDRGGDHSGELWATPYYVAPEKVMENREDYRSDIFSLGATLYHALTGRPPHKAETNSIQELRMIKCRRVSLEDSGLRFAARTVHVINRMLAFRPQERCANYDEAVEELRLAEGLVGQSYAARLSLRKLRWAGAVAAALALAFGIGWLARSNGERRAVAITDVVDTSRAEIDGGELRVQAGKQTVAQRFLAARELMLERGTFAEARHQFEKLIESGDARQPTLNWARFNAALCAIALGRRDAAEDHFGRMAKDTGAGSSAVSAELAAFFESLGHRMGTGLGLGTPLEKLNYATTNEEILGYLIQGLAEWHFGDPTAGIALIRHFSSRLSDVKVDSTTTALDWVPNYRKILNRYEADMELASKILGRGKPQTISACQTALAEVREVRDELRTSGTLRNMLERWQKTLERDLARMRIDEQRRQMAEQKTLRQRELAQYEEIMATLPSLVVGYDYSRVAEVLRDIRFESPEVQTALEGDRYLYEEAQAALQQLFADLKASGYTGKVHRRDASPLEGRITDGSLEKLTLTLDRGVVTVPTESVLPETLLSGMQHFAQQTTDSTDYYQRQERIAVFARVTGLQGLSATVAAQLMEENRAFRLRWMKVLH